MKKGWETKRVSEIAQHSLGKMLDKSKNKGEPKPYLRNLNVRWGEFDLSDILEMRFLPDEANKYTAVKGDVLVCEGGYPGRAAIWSNEEPIYFQKALHRVRFHEPGRNKWFVYFLQFRDLEGTLKNYFNGAGIQHFTGEALAQFEMPVPPLSDQQRIVGVLDEAFAGLATAKANAEKNLQNARALLESHLHSVFGQHDKGWLLRKLGDVCQTASGGTPLKLHKKYYEGGTIPWLLSGEVRQGEIHAATRFITKQGLENSAAKLFPKDTILIAMYGATAGQVGVLRFQSATNQAVCGILPNRQFVPEFLYYCFLEKKDELVAQAAGNAQPNISQIKIRNTLVPVPSLEEQRRVTSDLGAMSAEIQRLERLYRQKLAALDDLKKSLLHQAFSGAL